MAKPRGYPRIGTGFWDNNPDIKQYAAEHLSSGTQYQIICSLLKEKFGNLSQFNRTQIFRLKQKLRSEKR